MGGKWRRYWVCGEAFGVGIRHSRPVFSWIYREISRSVPEAGRMTERLCPKRRRHPSCACASDPALRTPGRCIELRLQAVLFCGNHRNRLANLAYTLWIAVRSAVNIDGMHQAYFESMQSRIGSRIREKREGNRWTQEELAHKASVSVSYLSKIENARCNPSLRELCRICVALRVEIRDLD